MSRRVLLASTWTALIVGLCWIPGRCLAHEGPAGPLDKLAHAGMFAVFSWLWAWACAFDEADRADLARACCSPFSPRPVRDTRWSDATLTRSMSWPMSSGRSSGSSPFASGIPPASRRVRRPPRSRHRERLDFCPRAIPRTPSRRGFRSGEGRGIMAAMDRSQSDINTGADVLVECLARQGVNHLFGMPGSHSTAIYDAFHRQGGIGTILVRNEQAGAFAADGYARATGRPGVVCTTAGPGATNALTGIAEAWADSVPVLLLAGQVNSDRMHLECGAYHEIDLEALFRPITKWCGTVRTVDQIPDLVRVRLRGDDQRPAPSRRLCSCRRTSWAGSARGIPEASIRLPDVGEALGLPDVTPAGSRRPRRCWQTPSGRSSSRVAERCGRGLAVEIRELSPSGWMPR